MDENNFLSNDTVDSVVSDLENKIYSTVTPKEIIEKIRDFSIFLNSTGRLTLLSADPEECHELVNLFLGLKKNIKSAISELGKSCNKPTYDFTCVECGESIRCQANFNFWETFQSHEHVEELYCNILNGSLQLSNHPTTNNKQKINETETSSEEGSTTSPITDLRTVLINGIDHTDSGLEQSDQQINDEDSSIEEDVPLEDNELPLGDNTFRFNFDVDYDPEIKRTLYPENVTAQKYDQCPYISIQRTSILRAVCLLCHCELLSIKRIFKKHCLDHILGQRHTKSLSIPENVESLKSYHETFLNLDVQYQAHQVYFEPSTVSHMLCQICRIVVPNNLVVDHIGVPSHVNKVLKMFHKNSNDFLLINQQVACYGIVRTDEQMKELQNRQQRVSTSKDEPDVPHEVVPSVVNTGQNAIQDFLHRRFQEHAKYFRDVSVHLVVCTLCNTKINKHTNALTKHITSYTHRPPDIKLKKYNYYCEICDKMFNDEIGWGKHLSTEQIRHSKISKIRVNKMEYECITCNTIIFGDEISVTRHKKRTMRREKKQQEKNELPGTVKELFKTQEFLEEQAKLLAAEANDSGECMRKTTVCASRIQNILSKHLTNCKTYAFGSRISGLGNKKSDLDLFVDIGDTYLGRSNQDSLAQCTIVKQVAAVLRKYKFEFEKIHEVPTARTPIVSVRHKSTELDCDLSFKHGLSVENTKFLSLCLNLQKPIAQQFILMLKKWSSLTKFSEHITNYAVAILAIFYLQVNGYLLSVKKIRELNPKPGIIIDGWETLCYTKPVETMKEHVTPYKHSLTTLLKDFFLYYSKFNYQEDVVCPLLGRTIKRKLFEDPKALPPEMETYINQLLGPDPERFRYLSVFCIQDPFDLSHNLTKALQNNTLKTFVKLCQLSYQHLESLK